MTIQQLEYILAVDQFRHFARAAEYCRVTQPTLSAMIQKAGRRTWSEAIRPYHATGVSYTDRREGDCAGTYHIDTGFAGEGYYQ